MSQMFSRLLIWARDHYVWLKWLLFAWLGLLVGLNVLFIHAHEAHFGLDGIPGFWAGFGATVGLIFVIVLKKIVFLIISRPEDFYESK